MNSDVKLILERALQFIVGGWTQGCLARTSWRGRQVEVYGAEARCFCLDGALQRASCELVGKPRGSGYMLAALTVEGLLDGEWSTSWNDAPERTKGQVVDLLCFAITEASGPYCA